MGYATPIDADKAYVEVKTEIKGLLSFADEYDQDDVMYTVNKLATVLRTVLDNYQNWGGNAIREFVLGKHDPLKNIDVKSDKFAHRVRSIQQDIILQFS
jgi:hypothetical protein